MGEGTCQLLPRACALAAPRGRGSPQRPAGGGVTEKLAATHTAASALSGLSPPLPLPFTAPGPPCLGLLSAARQLALPFLLASRPLPQL